MELSVNGRQRRAAQIVNAKPQTAQRSSGAGSALKGARSDKQEWSQAALSFLQEVNRQDQERQRKLLEAKRQGNGDLDALTKSLKMMDKCQKIASRIMRGDKVPPEDERYLMEHDLNGYKLALVCRQPKEKPKEWESVLDDEDREGGGESAGPAESASGGEAADSGGGTAEA